MKYEWLTTTYVREDANQLGLFEFGLVKHLGVGQDRFSICGRSRSRDLAEERARALSFAQMKAELAETRRNGVE